jgi:hypothetical protein
MRFLFIQSYLHVIIDRCSPDTSFFSRYEMSFEFDDKKRIVVVVMYDDQEAVIS